MGGGGEAAPAQQAGQGQEARPHVTSVIPVLDGTAGQTPLSARGRYPDSGTNFGVRWDTDVDSRPDRRRAAEVRQAASVGRVSHVLGDLQRRHLVRAERSWHRCGEVAGGVESGRAGGRCRAARIAPARNGLLEPGGGHRGGRQSHADVHFAGTFDRLVAAGQGHHAGHAGRRSHARILCPQGPVRRIETGRRLHRRRQDRGGRLGTQQRHRARARSKSP